MDGGGWWMMGGGSFVVLLLVALLVVFLIRRHEPHPDRPARSSAEDILAERFARGEIDEDEYRSRLDALRNPDRTRGA